MKDVEFKTEHILPIQPLDKNKEMFLSDLKTVGFWALKKAPSIAAIEPSKKRDFRPVSFGYC